MLGNTVNWKSLGLLAYSMRTGEPATEQVIPGGAWAYYAQNPEESRIFDEAMMGKAHGQIAGILAGYDFSPFKTIADIGGGRGHLLHASPCRYPQRHWRALRSAACRQRRSRYCVGAVGSSGWRFFQRYATRLRCLLDYASHSRLE
jgi:O-methyltransferase domain